MVSPAPPLYNLIKVIGNASDHTRCAWWPYFLVFIRLPPDIKASGMNSYYNPNPEGKNVGDCTVRALSKALDTTWEYTYTALALEGFLRHDMPSANAVWGAYLRKCGFVRHLAPEDITVEEFSAEHQKGVYVLALSGHVVCITDGVLHDTWDSSQEIVLYYWQRG